MGKARLPMNTTNRPRMSEADRLELRALFSQLAELQADAIIEELATQSDE